MPIAIIVAIGWLYVTVLMAASQDSLLAGVLTLVFYALLPAALLGYLFTAPGRRRRREARETAASQTATAEARSATAEPRRAAHRRGGDGRDETGHDGDGGTGSGDGA